MHIQYGKITPTHNLIELPIGICTYYFSDVSDTQTNHANSACQFQHTFNNKL